MATSVGRLTVLLGLDASEYTRGLTKAERDAQRMAQNTRTALLEIGKVIGSLEIGRQVIEATRAIISEAAALNDLADATGSTVEQLSKLNNQAKIAGTEFATLQTILLKLSAGMAGLDEDSTKAKEALKILGITTKDPAQALQEVAVKLNTYADGVNKVGLAVALFGKQGPAFLATLKDIAELQDVQATVTAKQAREAEELEKAIRRLAAESRDFANFILSSFVPALLSTIKEINASTRAAGGLWEAFRLFGGLDLTHPQQQIERLGKDIAIMQERAAKGRAFDWFNELPGQIADAQKKIAFARAMAIQRGEALISPDNADARDLRLGIKPQAPPPPGGKDRTRALKEQTSAAQKYLDSLEKQLQGTLELTAVEIAELEILELRKQKLSGLTPSLEKLIRLTALDIEQAKEKKKADDEAKRAAEEMAKVEQERARATFERGAAQMRENDQAIATNQQLADEIFLIGKDEAAHTALAQARIDDAIASEMARKARNAEALDSEENLALIQKQIDLLKERKGLLGQRDAALELAKEARRTQQLYDDLGGAIATAFEEAILNVNDLRGVLKALEQDLLRILARKLVTEPLANATSDVIQGIVKSIALAAASGGQGYGTAGSAIPAGPYPWASGTNYHPGGWAMVGERGPEIVNLPKGAQVIPNSSLKSKASVTNIYQSFAPGTDRKTVGQAAAAAGKAVRRGMERYA